MKKFWLAWAMASSALQAMEQNKSFAGRLPLELERQVLIHTGGVNLIESLKELHRLRRICKAWESLLRDPQTLSAFFALIHIPKLTEIQIIAVRNFTAGALIQRLSSEIDLVKCFYKWAKKSDELFLTNLLDSHTLIHEFCRSGVLSAVQCLLKLGADMEWPNMYDDPPLHVAIKVNQIEIVRLLLDNKANIESTNCRGIRSQPLHVAIREGRLAIVKLLVERGANKEAPQINGSRPLHEAVKAQEVEILKFLLEQNVERDPRDYMGFTPLHNAAVGGCIESVRLLLKHGAMRELRTYKREESWYPGMTALEIAIALQAKTGESVYQQIIDELEKECPR